MYKRQATTFSRSFLILFPFVCFAITIYAKKICLFALNTRLTNDIDTHTCLLYTSDAADERSSVDLGGRRIIKKKKKYIYNNWSYPTVHHTRPYMTTNTL